MGVDSPLDWRHGCRPRLPRGTKGVRLGVNVFVVAPGSSIEIGAANLVSGVLGALTLTSSVMARAVAMSRCSRIRQAGVLERVDLDLSRYDMRSDLLDL
jgi:hypothetical protein